MNYLNLLWFLPLIAFDVCWYFAAKDYKELLDDWKVSHINLFVLLSIGCFIIGIAVVTNLNK